jgi:hypothetical protein
VPIISAATDDDTNSSNDQRAVRRHIEPARAGIGVKAFAPVAEQALESEND